MAAAAEKKQFEEVFQSRRFSLPDFDRHGIWLLGRLKEKFPGLPERQAFGWLRGLTQSNAHFFVTNDKAILLAEEAHSQLNPIPIIREIFCFAQDGCHQAGASLYADLKRWADGLEASEISTMRCTDIPQPMIEDALGIKLQPRRIMVARLI